MKRRAFLAATAALAAPPRESMRRAGEPAAAPEWEAPLFHLEQYSAQAVRAARLELLKRERQYFVRAISSDGVEGVALVKQIEDYLPMLTRLAMPFFAGKDIRQLETLIDQYYVAHYKLAGQALWAPAAYVEQALFDLFGKTVNKPVGALLGGVRRKAIPVYLSGSGRETSAEEEVEVYAKALALSGAKAVKFKIAGRMARNVDVYPGRTETMLHLARSRYGPETIIYVDANGGYAASKAIAMRPLLKEINVGYFEEPCPWEEISETKKVADALDIPIAFGECDSSFWKFDFMIRTRALDIVQPDLNYNGGFIRTARVARMARRAGIPITPHNTQTGPAACNILQFASAIENTGPYMEFPFRGKNSGESWSAPQFHIHGGKVAVPEGPGLGVTIDPDYLRGAAVIASVSA